jgi:PadR family transcriptional regulator PadR
LSQSFRDEIVEHIFRKLLDIIVLKLIQREATWGYEIIQTVEKKYGIKLRHGALYPLLNTLEKKGFIEGSKLTEKGRVRKVYTITTKGAQFIAEYDETLQQI